VPKEFAAIVLGDPGGDRRLALGIGLAGLFVILVFHVIITWFSLRYRRRTQRLLSIVVNPFERAISRTFSSRQHFDRGDISPYFRVNGYPPPGDAYQVLAANDFRDYRLSVGGLVEHPLNLSLEQLRALGEQAQITKHNCIQGWTAVAEWAGVPLARLMEEVRPSPEARHVVFYAMDDKGLTEGEGRYGFFYGTIPIHLANDPQTILALEMNGAPLPVEHGAPVRLRLETQLGFKMVKWVVGIEFVTDVTDIGQGMGGWREDQQFYANAAGI
jgi:DMSO/TMAO reductase YedYZ molybdopterin-dependent catalytic subunit